MSISSEITRLQTLRNNIRTKLIALGIISDSSASLNDCYTGIDGITKKTAQTYTPTTSNQTIDSGQYLSGAQTISGDSNLVSGNIKQGVSIFGVEGSHAGQKTEQSKTVTPTASGFTVSPDSGKVLSSVVINGDADLVAGNVKKDVEIFGVTGTYIGATAKVFKITLASVQSGKWVTFVESDADIAAHLNDSSFLFEFECLSGFRNETSMLRLTKSNILFGTHTVTMIRSNASSCAVNSSNYTGWSKTIGVGRIAIDSTGKIELWASSDYPFRAGDYMIVCAW